jgi:hypothetical protein
MGRALPLLLKGLGAYRGTCSGLAVPYRLSIPGDTDTQVGRYEEARKALGEGLATSEKNDDRFEAVQLRRLKEPPINYFR